MGPLDAVWHLLNFFAPAAGVALLTAGLVKLAWWRSLRGTPWWRLAAWGAAAAALASLAALVAFGREGSMAGYGLMLVACSLGVWWAGPRRAGR